MATDTGLDPAIPTPTETTTESSASECLTAGVPLTLLWDLASAHGPDSDAIFTEEPPDSMDWIPTQRPETLGDGVSIRTEP
jgi:hypothetical protein